MAGEAAAFVLALVFCQCWLGNKYTCAQNKLFVKTCSWSECYVERHGQVKFLARAEGGSLCLSPTAHGIINGKRRQYFERSWPLLELWSAFMSVTWA